MSARAGGALTSRTETRRIVDISVPGGSSRRMARLHDAKAGDALVPCQGFGKTDEPFRRPRPLWPADPTPRFGAARTSCGVGRAGRVVRRAGRTGWRRAP